MGGGGEVGGAGVVRMGEREGISRLSVEVLRHGTRELGSSFRVRLSSDILARSDASAKAAPGDDRRLWIGRDSPPMHAGSDSDSDSVSASDAAMTRMACRPRQHHKVGSVRSAAAYCS